MISPAIRPPTISCWKRTDAADNDHDECLNQDRLADIGRDRDQPRNSTTWSHGADAEHQHEDLVDVDAERIATITPSMPARTIMPMRVR